MQLPDFLHNVDDEIRLNGHQIRLIEVAQRYDEGFSVEEIVEYYPSLSLAEVHKAVAFYLENQPEVASLVKANQDEMDRLRAETPAAPSLAELRTRFAKKYPLLADGMKVV